MQPLRKIVIIGPESTGKSTLCEALAAYYHTDWTPEYAREYLLAHGMDYRYEDLLTIAKGQVAQEDAMAAALIRRARSGAALSNPDQPGLSGPSQTGEPGASGPRGPILFIDTDLYVMKVWSEFVFGKCDPWINDQIGVRKYDGYLLCCTDLPWVRDDLREYPDLANREKLFEIYRDQLTRQHTPWAEVSGAADARLGAAVKAVDGLIG